MAFWMEISDKHNQRLSEEEITQVILKSCIPKFQKQITKASFLRNFYIRQSEIDNFYEIYKADLNIRTITNDYIYNEKKVNRSIMKDLEQAIFNDECFIYFFSGMPGCGKSWLALKYSYDYVKVYYKIKDKSIKANWFLDPDEMKIPSISLNIGKNPEEEINIYVSYSNSQSTYLLQKAPERSLIVQDESPTQHGKGSKIAKDNLSNLVKIVSRRNTINLIIINPIIFPIDNINYYLRVLGKNKDSRQTLSLLLNAKMQPVGLIDCIVDIPEKLASEYQKWSKVQKTKIQQQAGQSGVTISEIELNRLANLLITELVPKYHIRRQKEFINYSAMVPDVAGHVQIQLICSEAARLVRDASPENITPVDNDDEEDEEDNEDPIIIQESNVKLMPDDFAKYASDRVNMINIPEVQVLDKKIFQHWIYGMTMGEIAQLSEINIQPPQISKRLRKFREGFAENLGISSVGKMFQDFCRISKGLKADNTYEHDSPDIIIGNTTWTIKFEADQQKSYYRYSEKFGPELRWYNEDKSTRKIRFLYFNLCAKNREILDVKLDPESQTDITIGLDNKIQFANHR
jgi:hypothetical protein